MRLPRGGRGVGNHLRSLGGALLPRGERVYPMDISLRVVGLRLDIGKILRTIIERPKRGALIALGGLSFVLGLIGVFLPLLPTTPFLLLTAYLWSRNSRTFYEWLVGLPRLGRLILDWEERRVISKSSKLWATLLIGLGFVVGLLIFELSYVFLITYGLVMPPVMVFIWRQRSV